ncbi:MAG: Nif3-like dinuclear metal center hexameric protein, partial [Clostridia bacterium]|nr:Nif3-like dinuclear metal center hexameric protein [Clostridia bacterium]
MKISEIIDLLEQYAPIALADEGDRPKVGLQMGSVNNECTGVVTCLDVTLDVLKKAVENGCNMVVSHHPMIYYPLQKIDESEVNGKAIAYAFRNDITIYSAHTNFDKCEVGTNASLVKMFDGKIVDTFECCFVAEVEPISVRDLAKKVANVLGDKSVKVVGNLDKTVTKFAVCSGGGGGAYSYFAYARNNADVYISGDMPHHMYREAVGRDFPVIEFSHYASEIMAEDVFASILADKIKVIKANQLCP